MVLKKILPWFQIIFLYSLENHIELCEYCINLIFKNTFEIFKCSELENKISSQESKLIIDNKPLFYELMCFLFEVELVQKKVFVF